MKATIQIKVGRKVTTVGQVYFKQIRRIILDGVSENGDFTLTYFNTSDFTLTYFNTSDLFYENTLRAIDKARKILSASLKPNKRKR